MFRTITLTSLLTLSLASGIATASTEVPAAEQPVAGEFAHGHYEVYYRRDCGCRWRRYDCFDCHEEAHRAARWLRRQGFDAYVRH